MNALKPRKGFVQDELSTERLTPMQWSGIMRAMRNYARHYHETMQANDFEKQQERCTVPVTSKRFLVTYRYNDRTDAAIHEDEIEAVNCVEACNKVCKNHNYEIKWHTVKEKTDS